MSWNAMQNDPLEEAFNLYRVGKPEAAIAAYKAILMQDPENAEANHMIGVLAFQQGKHDIARDFIQRAVASKTGATPEMYNNLGSVMLSLNDYDAAANAFDKAIQMRPDYVDALNNLGVTHRNARRIEKAIE